MLDAFAARAAALGLAFAVQWRFECAPAPTLVAVAKITETAAGFPEVSAVCAAELRRAAPSCAALRRAAPSCAADKRCF